VFHRRDGSLTGAGNRPYAAEKPQARGVPHAVRRSPARGAEHASLFLAGVSLVFSCDHSFMMNKNSGEGVGVSCQGIQAAGFSGMIGDSAKARRNPSWQADRVWEQ
jgi:hypothetical protein